MTALAWVRSSIGKKALMALSGLALALFVLMHLAGNLLIFAGPDAMNGYAVKLRHLGPWLWVARAAGHKSFQMTIFKGAGPAVRGGSDRGAALGPDAGRVAGPTAWPGVRPPSTQRSWPSVGLSTPPTRRLSLPVATSRCESPPR